MPISVTRQRNGFTTIKTYVGFTIMELLVVLVVIGLAVGIALPSFYSQYQRLLERQNIDEVLKQVKNWPDEVYKRRYSVRLEAREKPYDQNELNQLGLSFQKDWQVRVLSSVQYLPSGICLGGGLIIEGQDITEEYVLSAPLCEPTIASVSK